MSPLFSLRRPQTFPLQNINIVNLVPWLLCLAFCPISFGQDRAKEAEEFRLQLYKIAQSLPVPETIGREPEKELQAVDQFSAILKSCEEAEKDFAKEIASQIQPYRNLAGTISYSRERIAKVKDALLAYASVDEIKRDADAILNSAKQSVEYQAPAYFKPGNDIARRTESMKQRLASLEKLKPNSAELQEGKSIIEKTASEVRKIQMQLLEGILSQNELPTDNYKKGDRKELLKLVEETWVKNAPKVKPIRVGLIGDDWTRTDAWEIQNRTAYKVDRSRIQGFVVLPNDNKTVLVKHIQMNRDHTNQDKTTAWAINDPKAPPEPMEMVLKSKLK